MAAPEHLTLIVSRYTCLRCGYHWIGRDPDVVPRRCAACTSPYWNRPRRKTRRGRPEAGRIILGAPMPLFGGQWQWPVEQTWGYYRLSLGAEARLRAAGVTLARRAKARVFAVWHPPTPQPPPELLLVETPAPLGWSTATDPEKAAVLPSLRRIDEPKLKFERPWTAWRRPQAMRVG